MNKMPPKIKKLVVVFQNIFRAEIHQNNVFFLKKIIF